MGQKHVKMLSYTTEQQIKEPLNLINVTDLANQTSIPMTRLVTPFHISSPRRHGGIRSGAGVASRLWDKKAEVPFVMFFVITWVGGGDGNTLAVLRELPSRPHPVKRCKNR